MTCLYCKQKFDRDKEAYATTGKKRYAHASCYLRKKAEDDTTPKMEIINPLDFVTCIYCKKTFNKAKEPFKMFSNGKYCHEHCFELEQKRELTDQEKLEKYIMNLFGTDFVSGRIQKQIKDYVVNNGYTYSGIQKALIYYYEITGHVFNKDRTNGGIGIVPFVYNKAYNYYYSIWEAQQKQEQQITDTVSIERFVPKTVEVHILSPKRKEKKRQLFTFLDEEESKEE